MANIFKKQQLVYSIIDFLNQSIADDTVKEEDKESLDIAIQCIRESFGIDASDEAQASKLTIKPATLENIFDVFLQTRKKVSPNASEPGAASSSSSPSAKSPSPANKAEAEKLKQVGNSKMSSKDYDGAIEAYTKAIDVDATNPVYFSNRAAAYSIKGDHLSAIADAEQAIILDPKFVKAYSRLGHAQYSISDFSAAVSAFERGLELEPGNSNLKTGFETAKARVAAETASSSASSRSPGTRAADPSDILGGTGGGASRGASGTPNFSDLLGSLGGGGGGGGMPDIASLLSNPAIMQMASQMAANGGLDSLLQNPNIANMANRFRSGDTPSMEELMNNPELRNLAQQFGGGGGAAGR